MRLPWRLSLPAVLIFSLTGCIDFADFSESDRYKEDFHFSYPLSAGGTLSLENANGSVEISGWEKDTVEINGTKYAQTKSLLDGVKVETSASQGAVRIRTVRPVDTHGGSGARYSIRVPRKVLLDAITTTNGGIRVQDVTGNSRLRSTNGSIRVQQLSGELEAHTTNGTLEAINLDGNARLQTTNGSIKAESSHGSLEATTSNGSINVELTDPAVNWPVKLRSTNGHIEARLKSEKLPDVRAETSNSSVSIHLPANANARMRAHTSHASITSDFDVSSGDTRSKNDLEGNIGAGGGPLIELSSTNGSIKILKN